MKTKTLTQTSHYAIFRDRYDTPWICAAALRHKVAVPKNCRKIRICITKDEPDNDGWFALNPSPTIGGVAMSTWDLPIRGIRMQLTTNLKTWLNSNILEGYRYGFIDYLS